jgi:alpha-L-fucosidase 2
MKYLNISILILLLTPFSCNNYPKEEIQLDSSQTLWYKSPATQWPEALPLGNGRLGAMVYGGTENETIQFNEETLWSGQPHDYVHKGAHEHLDKLRQLLWEGKQDEDSYS